MPRNADSTHESDLVGLFSDLVRTETRLYNAVNDRMRTGHGLYASQFEFLLYLRGHSRARVADLAGHFAVGVGAASKGLDRLESRGLVRRVRNPNDGRSSLLELTPAGTELVNEAKATFDQELDALIAPPLTRAQLEQFAATLAALLATLEEAKTGTPAG